MRIISNISLMRVPLMSIAITPLKESAIKELAEFAAPIWHDHYTAIIGQKQVEYMLEKFQSEKAIEQQIAEKYRYYEVTKDGSLIGYFSIQLRDRSSLFISKFYLAKSARGCGAGRNMLSFIESLAKEHDCKTIDLTVNKYNSAYEVYLKLGFSKIGEAEFDIGQGYIMDDYLMSKPVSLS